VEGICHFWVFPAVIKAYPHVRMCHQSPSSFTELRPKSSQASHQGLAREVRMYCFRLGNCGTFMPLSGVRGIFRIAVVWTRFVAAISAISSIHFNVLFTRAVVRLAVDCG